jgi:outer membrane protein assembly factor BamA
VDLRVENFRGRKEILNIIAKGGYDQFYSANWQIPYLNKEKTFGMGFETSYRLNHEIAVSILDNKYIFYKTNTSYARKMAKIGTNFTYRPGYRYLHQFDISFFHLQLEDSILIINPEYTYGPNKYNYFKLNYTYKQDNRDFKAYPLKGYYFDIQLSKIGLGLFNEDVNQLMMDVNADHYFNIYKKWDFAYSLRGRLSYTNNFQPFFLVEGIGLNGFNVRGYELYVITGQNIGVFKSNLKFSIVPMRDFQIKWLKSDKFSKVFYGLYANIFFDMGYAKDKYYYQGNPLSNQLLWGSGIGLDFVTYYDIVIGLSYAINKQQQKGFYVSLVAPI